MHCWQALLFLSAALSAVDAAALLGKDFKSRRDILGAALEPELQARSALLEDHLEEGGMHLEKRKKKKNYQGIDFSKARGESYVRIYLASSIRYPKQSEPIAITVPHCMEFDKKLDDPSAVASCYNPNPLSTSFLSQDPAEARNCQAFRLHNEDGGSVNVRKNRGYKVSVTISNNTDSTIGWCSDGSSPPVWVENAAGADKKEQFKADCQSWWRRYSGGPSFYGENCLLRLVASKKQNVCISASNDKPGDTKRLQTAKCNIKDFYQLWDIASVAKEFPDWGKDGCSGSDCWGPLYDKDPHAVFEGEGEQDTSQYGPNYECPKAGCGS